MKTDDQFNESRALLVQAYGSLSAIIKDRQEEYPVACALLKQIEAFLETNLPATPDVANRLDFGFSTIGLGGKTMNTKTHRETAEQIEAFARIEFVHDRRLKAHDIERILSAAYGEWIAVSERLPENNVPVFACCGKFTLRAVYVRAKTIDCDDMDFDDGGGEYDEATDKHYWPEGWYEWNEYEETHWSCGSDKRPITHWRPLPPPPEKENV